MLRRGALAVAALGVGLGAFQAGAARADDFPNRPLTMIVPFTSGGSTEIMARVLGAGLESRLGKPVVVENKPGAGTVIGSNYVAKSAPDGYTMLMATPAPIAINVTVHKALPYNPVTDFVPLAMVAQSPFVLVVNNDLPARSVAELIALAKRQPGRLDFASGSTGSTGHLAGELFKQMTGTFMVHIPYKGSAPAVADLLAGRVQLMFDNQASAAPNIQAGKVRALAVTTLKRSSFLPDLPTLDESGLKGFDMTTWWGLMAPAQTPQPVVDRLAAESSKALQSPDTQERWRTMGSDIPSVRTPAQFTAFVERERKLYADLVKRSGATVD
jgi:tripartite-type tricarboxylate transporter receptor subunit TctC